MLWLQPSVVLGKLEQVISSESVYKLHAAVKHVLTRLLNLDCS